MYVYITGFIFVVFLQDLMRGHFLYCFETIVKFGTFQTDFNIGDSTNTIGLLGTSNLSFNLSNVTIDRGGLEIYTII